MTTIHDQSCGVDDISTLPPAPDLAALKAIADIAELLAHNSRLHLFGWGREFPQTDSDGNSSMQFSGNAIGWFCRLNPTDSLQVICGVPKFRAHLYFNAIAARLRISAAAVEHLFGDEEDGGPTDKDDQRQRLAEFICTEEHCLGWHMMADGVKWLANAKEQQLVAACEAQREVEESEESERQALAEEEEDRRRCERRHL